MIDPPVSVVHHTKGMVGEGGLVHPYLATARFLRPVFTLVVTLMAIASMGVLREEPGRPEELRLVGPLLEATRSMIIVEGLG